MIENNISISIICLCLNFSLDVKIEVSLDTDTFPLSGILISSTLGAAIFTALIAIIPKGVSNHQDYKLLYDGISEE